jgi:membrane-bound lytic murein transglycosylase B
LGVEFWNENADTLARAYDTYGVPAEIVVAIIGVETRYGEHKGRYPIMDSLTTLAFDFPKRGKFFRGELEQFLLLTREEEVDPLSLKGSYAGAMGKPQFIASSYRNYAVDFDGDGKRDILNSSVDAIGSVANYFNRHNWKKDEPIAGKARVKGKKYKPIIKKGIKPSMRLRDMARKGVHVDGKYAPEQLAALIEFKNKKGHEYWVGFNNFYVITRYNHSELYAMAVYQLSQAIAQKRNALQAQKLTTLNSKTSVNND